VPVRRILLVGHTHHDVGYTNSPRIVDPLHARIVGEVLDLCDRHDGDGPDAFRWTFEVARPVLAFLRAADVRDRERLRRRVAEGRIAVTGGYLNMTQLPGDAELDAAYDLLGELRAAGIPVRTEQHGDVNGIAWGAVPAMRRAGLSRLVMALNPDHGRPPFPQPSAFWWAGPGRASVFVWLSTHYGFGEEWGIVDGDTTLAEERIADFVAGLDARDDHPYDTAVVHAANDNRWPTARFLDVVRAWNAAHPEVPMRTATIDEALDLLEPQAAGAPVVRGEWSDWWSHGHGSTAREVAVYREAAGLARLAQAGLSIARLRGEGAPALAEVIGYRRGPVRLRDEGEVDADLAAVDEQLLLFGEHTWGSWETYLRPHSTFSASAWNAKAGFAYAALDLARDLAIEGLHRAAASGGQGGDGGTGAGVLVLNPSERARREPVEVEVDGVPATLVADVPAFATALLPAPAAPRPAGRGRVLEHRRFRAEVDPASGGVVSLVDLTTGRQLVDPRRWGLGAVVVETIAPGSTHPMLTDPKAFHPEDPGPAFDRTAARGEDEPGLLRGDGFARITWTSAAAGVPAVRSALTLFDDLDVVDLAVSLVKPERFGPESVFVAFPFAARRPAFLLETAGAVYEAEREQLPDTSKDWYSVQHAVAVVDGGSAVLWASADAPLVQLGGVHTGEWARTLEVRDGSVNSWLMNNLHFTNFQARQDGTGTYRYRFAPRASVSPADVRLFGRSLREPLLARQYRGPVGPAEPAVAVEPAERVLAELRPLPDGRVRARLRNPAPDPVAVTVRVPGGAPQRVEVPGYDAADVVLPC
jgi:hypothetical protein